MNEKMRKREARKALDQMKAYEKFQTVAIFPIGMLDFKTMYEKALDDNCNVDDLIRWYKEAIGYLVDTNDLEDICRFMASHRVACVWAVLLGKSHHGKKKSQ